MVDSATSDNDPQWRSQYASADGFGERVKKSLFGKTMKWLSDETGLSTSVLSDYQRGKIPRADNAVLIADALKVDLKWLIQGTANAPQPGKLLERHPPWTDFAYNQRDEPDLVEIDEIDLRYGLGGSYAEGAVIEGLADVSKRRFSREWLRNFTRAAPEFIFWAKTDGDSMEPTIRSGEVVLIDRSDVSPRSADGIWAVAISEIGMIKRLRPLRDGNIEILSDNAVVPPAIAADGELHVIGRVLYVVRRV